MSAENRSRTILKSWLDKNFPGEKLPQASLDLHNFINDVEFEFHASIKNFNTSDLIILQEAGIISYEKNLTRKGRSALMKLLQ